MDRALRTTARLALAVVVLSGALAACGDDGDDEGTPSRDPDLTVTVQLTSDEQRLSNVGPDDSVVYGWNLLRGSGTVAGAADEGSAEVEMLGNVAYRDGNGPFFGFITFTFDDDATLAVRMDGEADASTDTSHAAFEADLQVLGGTGRLVDAAGTGTFEGQRTEELGGAVESTFTIWLDDAE